MRAEGQLALILQSLRRNQQKNRTNFSTKLKQYQTIIGSRTQNRNNIKIWLGTKHKIRTISTNYWIPNTESQQYQHIIGFRTQNYNNINKCFYIVQILEFGTEWIFDIVINPIIFWYFYDFIIWNLIFFDTVPNFEFGTQ